MGGRGWADVWRKGVFAWEYKGSGKDLHAAYYQLKNAFSNPGWFRPGVTRRMVTQEAAERFSALAHQLQAQGFEPHRVAHFLNRIIFCMFAEDVGLLPNRIFARLAAASVAHPATLEGNARPTTRFCPFNCNAQSDRLPWR